MFELSQISATELRALLQQRECSAEEVTQSCLRQIERLEPTVKAFVDLQPEAALEQARALDRARTQGPMHGIPVAVKDTVDVKGMRCTWGTPIHANRIPDKDSAVVRRLKEAGAVILGTTVTTEYAIAKAGPTTNPHNPARTPGGSSSGSGAAVAAQMAPISVATQSVGSIIRPGSFCGVFALKPTRGAISTLGAMALSPRLDHVGPMARTIADIELASRVMFGLEHDDANGCAVSAPQTIPLPPKLRVLRMDGPLQDRIEPPTTLALERAQKVFEDGRLDVKAVDLPERFGRLITCYETIIFADLAERYASDMRTHGALMSPRFKEILETGLAVTPKSYQAAVDDADYYTRVIGELLQGDTVILAPATDGYAPPMSDRTGEQKLQSLWTVVGMPSLCCPCGKLDGLPVSVQVIAGPGKESLVLAAARLIEERYGRANLLEAPVSAAT